MFLRLALGLSDGPVTATDVPEGAPEWVPENAVIHIDLVGGSPQGRAWVEGTGEVDVDTLLGADPNTDNSWSGTTAYDSENLTADGYTIGPVAPIGALRTQLLAGCTIAFQFKQWDAGNNTFQFALVDANGNADVRIDVNTSGDVEASSIGGELDEQQTAIVNSGTGSINRIAITLTPTRLEFTMNGKTEVVEAALSTDDFPVSGDDQIVAGVLELTGIYALQSITIYEALPDTTGLSALSETGVTNTAPHDIELAWEGGDDTFTLAESASASTIGALTATDDQGNPLTFTIVADESGVLAISGSTIVTDDDAAAGEHDFTVRAIDPGGLFVEQEFTITVTA